MWQLTQGRKAAPSSLRPGGPAAQPTIYEFHQTKPFHAGGMSYAYDNIWWDPKQSPIGAGTQIAGLRSLPPAPAYSTAYTTSVDLGGVLQGQYILQPLVDTTI